MTEVMLSSNSAFASCIYTSASFSPPVSDSWNSLFGSDIAPDTSESLSDFSSTNLLFVAESSE